MVYGDNAYQSLSLNVYWILIMTPVSLLCYAQSQRLNKACLQQILFLARFVSHLRLAVNENIAFSRKTAEKHTFCLVETYACFIKRAQFFAVGQLMLLLLFTMHSAFLSTSKTKSPTPTTSFNTSVHVHLKYKNMKIEQKNNFVLRIQLIEVWQIK